MEDNKDFLTEETEGTTDNDTMYADTEETLEKAASLNDDSFSGNYSFSEFDSDAEAAEEVEEAEAPEFDLRHKTDPAALGDGGASEEDEADDAQAKVGRNEPCPCGSGKKFKKCCGR